VGLRFCDSSTPTASLIGPLRSQAARKSLNEANLSPTRIFVGQSKEREVKITLYDVKGKVRINMVVDPSGAPRLDFLGENGKVTYSVPGNIKAHAQKDQ